MGPLAPAFLTPCFPRFLEASVRKPAPGRSRLSFHPVFLPNTKGHAMKIPEDLRIPAIVFGLQAALLAGCSLIFLVLRP